MLEYDFLCIIQHFIRCSLLNLILMLGTLISAIANQRLLSSLTCNTDRRMEG